MGRLALALLALLALPSPGRALDAWTQQDVVLESAFVVAGVLDIALTQQALREGAKERNPVLGMSPSPARLWAWGLTGLAFHAGVAALLPSRPRTLWQSMGLTVELAVASGNATIVVGGRL